MRVIENLNSEVLFEDVEKGEVFKYGDVAFIKIEEVGSISNDIYDNTYNAVNLVTGGLSHWNNDDTVICYPYAEVTLNPN